MDSSFANFFKWFAIGFALLWGGWELYHAVVEGRPPGDLAYLEANNLFDDGAWDRALARYREAQAEAPDHLFAMRGEARSLMQLGRYEEALAVFNKAIALEPDFAASYANRGILYDRMGQYEKAIADYEKSVQLDMEVAEGPHWLTRFLRKQPDKPPTVADRALYLRAELAKPPGERKLRDPEADSAQRTYQQ